MPLQWRHDGRDGVLNHQPHHCLFNRWFRRRPRKTSKLRVTGLCAGNSPVTGEFPAQRASNAENVSIWWRHHAISISPVPTRRSHRFYIPSLQKHWWLKSNVHRWGDNYVLIATVYQCIKRKLSYPCNCIRTRNRVAWHSTLWYHLLTFFIFVHEFHIIQTC